MTAIEKIEAQQKGKNLTDVWMVGEQLKDILRADPSLEELISTDLDVKDMSLADCAGKIKTWADTQKSKIKGRCVCVPPNVAEGIIREFYGLPEAGALAPVPAPAPQPPEDDIPLDFGDFL